MIIPKSLEDVASHLERPGKQVLFFKADWCGDCQFIYPSMPDIEAAFPELTFIQLDRDDYLILAEKWGVFGIPSFIVLENGRELARLVNKKRKTKEEIISFLAGLV